MDDDVRSELSEAGRVLRRVRPSPRPQFERELEDALLAAAPPARAGRVAAQGAALVVALALLMVSLTAAGLLPGAPGADEEVTARDTCGTVTALRRQRVPRFVVGRGGADRIVYDVRVRRIAVKRCR
jgi:hypothetical protein